MKEQKNKEKNISEFLALIKAIFDCPYTGNIFVKKNLKDIKEIALKKLYPINYIIKNVNTAEDYNSLKNEPILYFPSAKKITIKIDEKQLGTKSPFPSVKLNTKIIFKLDPNISGYPNRIIGGELYLDYDCDASYKKNNTLLDVFTIYELLLSIKNKNKRNKILNALNDNLKEKFNTFAETKREKINSITKIKKKIYGEHYEYYENTSKIKKYYQHKTLISARKGKSKILFDGYCDKKEMDKFLIRAFEDIIIFYKVFFTDIILN